MDTTTYLDTWNDDKYKALFKQAQLRLTPQRAFVLINALQHALVLEGDVIEMGVYKGSSAYIIAHTMQNSGKKLHLFDTFEGTPKHTEKDNVSREGWYGDTSLEAVGEFLKEFDFLEFHQGFIPDTFTDLPEQKYSFVHIHLNLYESTLCALEYIYEKMSVGGVVMIEDYGLVKCAGVKLAVDNFVEKNNIHVIHLPTSQGMIIKI